MAVASRDRERAEEFAKKHKVQRVYGSYEELAQDPDIGESINVEESGSGLNRKHWILLMRLSGHPLEGSEIKIPNPPSVL